MPTTTTDAYLEAKLADVAAIMNGADAAFNYTARLPVLDPEELTDIPRWPKAIITDFGGEIDQYNGKVWTNQMAVTVVVARQRQSSRAARDLAVLGGLLTAALTHDYTDSGISLIARSDEVAEVVGETRIYMQTYLFEYKIEVA